MPRSTPASSNVGPLDSFRDDVAIGVARCLALRPGASMDELALSAGVSRATLFRRFPSREALINELCGSAVKAFLAVVELAEPEAGEAQVAWSRVVEGVAGLAPVFGLLGLQPLAAHVEAALLAQAAEGENRVKQLVKRGQKSGAFSEDIDPEWVLTLLTWSTVGLADTVRLGRMTLAAAEQHMQRTLEGALR